MLRSQMNRNIDYGCHSPVLVAKVSAHWCCMLLLFSYIPCQNCNAFLIGRTRHRRLKFGLLERCTRSRRLPILTVYDSTTNDVLTKEKITTQSLNLQKEDHSGEPLATRDSAEKAWCKYGVVMSRTKAIKAGLLGLLAAADHPFATTALGDGIGTGPEQEVRSVQMKIFNDPMGLFSIRVPDRFYTLRRSAKGDLPNERTGQGRRGSSIFTAGDMSKAEVIAVERFLTANLLEEEGIDASGNLSTFTFLGKPQSVAELLVRRRDRERSGQSTRTTIMPNSIEMSSDGKTLQFRLRTDIDVQNPELLFEETGFTELVRVTLARAELRSNDGHIMACYASALQQDFDGVEGDLLKEALASFEARDQS